MILGTEWMYVFRMGNLEYVVGVSFFFAAVALIWWVKAKAEKNRR